MVKYNDTVRNTEDKGENRGRYITINVKTLEMYTLKSKRRTNRG